MPRDQRKLSKRKRTLASSYKRPDPNKDVYGDTLNIDGLDLSVPSIRLTHSNRKQTNEHQQYLDKRELPKNLVDVSEKVQPIISSGVLASDAHYSGNSDEEDGRKGYHAYTESLDETAKLARDEASRIRSKQMVSDYTIADSMDHHFQPRKVQTQAATASNRAKAVVETQLPRQLLEETTSQTKLEILKRDSPEVLRLLDDLKAYTKEIAKLTNPLSDLIRLQRPHQSPKDSELVSFLEAKYHLLLTYCVHISYYLMLKVERFPVKGHPVVDRLVELRVYLEKMFQVEQRLSHSLQQLLSHETSAAAVVVAQKPRIDMLRPVTAPEQVTLGNRSLRTSDRIDELRRSRIDLEQAEKLEREEQETMSRALGRTGPSSQVLTSNLDELREARRFTEDKDEFLANIHRNLNGDSQNPSQTLGQLKNQLNKLRGTKRKRPRETKEQEDSSTSSEDGGEEEDSYTRLLRKQREEDKNKFNIEEVNEDEDKHVEDQRRKASTQILSRRGLTKSRSHKRKTPRVNRRLKAAKGEQDAAAQSRRYKPESDKGFEGVSNLKSHITHSTKL